MAVLEAVASAAVGDGHQGADVLLADQVAVDEGVPRVFDPSELRRDEEAVKPGMAEGACLRSWARRSAGLLCQ